MFKQLQTHQILLWIRTSWGKFPKCSPPPPVLFICNLKNPPEIQIWIRPWWQMWMSKRQGRNSMLGSRFLFFQKIRKLIRRSDSDPWSTTSASHLSQHSLPPLPWLRWVGKTTQIRIKSVLRWERIRENFVGNFSGDTWMPNSYVVELANYSGLVELENIFNANNGMFLFFEALNSNFANVNASKKCLNKIIFANRTH